MDELDQIVELVPTLGSLHDREGWEEQGDREKIRLKLVVSTQKVSTSFCTNFIRESLN